MKFSDIPAQEIVKSRLRHMVDSDRIPHALLLEGPAGVGKFALARAFAQYVHCTNRTADGEPCGNCASCRQHESFNHADLYFSFPMLKSAAASGICDDIVDDWRKFVKQSPYMEFDQWLQIMGNPNGQPVIYTAEAQSIARKFATTSYSSRYKIMLMWLPERMQTECANKLLKLIEEPFPDSLLIFVSNNGGEILPTIYSRLQRVAVNRLPDTEISQYLQSRLNVDASDATAIAHLAEGQITKAMAHVRQSKEQTEFLEMFMILMRAAYQRKVGLLKKWSNDIAAWGREAEVRFLSYCERMMRENFLNNLHMPQIVYLTHEEQQFSNRFSPFINERNVEKLLAEFTSARSDIAANANAKIVMFNLAVHVILLLKQ